MRILVIPLSAMASTAFGQMLAQSPAPQISGNWLVDLRTLCAVGSVVLLGTWRIGRWMRRIEDRMDAGEARFSSIEKNMNQRDEMLRSIDRKVDRLPCVEGEGCPQERRGKR